MNKVCLYLTVSVLLLISCSTEEFVPATVRLSGSSEKVWTIEQVSVDTSSIDTSSFGFDTTFFDTCTLCGLDGNMIKLRPIYPYCLLDDRFILRNDSIVYYTVGDSSCYEDINPNDTLFQAKWWFNDLETTIRFESVDDEELIENEYIIRNLNENTLELEYYYEPESAENSIFALFIPPLEGGERVLFTLKSK